MFRFSGNCLIFGKCYDFWKMFWFSSSFSITLWWIITILNISNVVARTTEHIPFLRRCVQKRKIHNLTRAKFWRKYRILFTNLMLGKIAIYCIILKYCVYWRKKQYCPWVLLMWEFVSILKGYLTLPPGKVAHHPSLVGSLTVLLPPCCVLSSTPWVWLS